jgi:sarcosine oxidase subunit gamma
VAEEAHNFVSALDGVTALGRSGRSTSSPGVIVSEVREAGLATVTARKGRRAALADATRTAFGIEPPVTPKWVQGPELAFIWSGPDQWLVYKSAAPPGGMEALLARPLANLASIVDQSHGRTILRVTGHKAREALAKGVTIDLHPRAFKPGDTAATLASHIAVQLWQIDDHPTYEFAVARGFAQSFWRWLEASAAEFALEFLGK